AVSESNTTIDRSSIRGNMNKELRRPSMTWNVLCKGLKFLKFEVFTVYIEGQLIDGKDFNAYTSVTFNPESKFIATLPPELPSGHAVRRKDGKAMRAPHRPYTSGFGGILSRLFNLICLNLTEGRGFSQEQWNHMLTLYIDETEG